MAAGIAHQSAPGIRSIRAAAKGVPDAFLSGGRIQLENDAAAGSRDGGRRGRRTIHVSAEGGGAKEIAGSIADQSAIDRVPAVSTASEGIHNGKRLRRADAPSKSRNPVEYGQRSHARTSRLRFYRRRWVSVNEIGSIAGAAGDRNPRMSRIGGWPKKRLYSRLNWLALS